MFKNFTRLLLYLAGFLLLSLVAVFLVYKLINFNKLVIPSLKGKSISEAQELLEVRGLPLKVEDEVYDAEIPKNLIVRQEPVAGEKAGAGTEIRVFLSKGVELFSMPSFEGQPFDDARLTLINLGIKVGKVTRVHSDTVRKGLIIAQRPLPGNVRSNKANFLVSLGSYKVSYKCPFFVSMSVADARKIADMLGIKLIEQEEGDVVIYQKPEAGVIIERGDSVEVTLGRVGGLWF
jgi:beta-lactam-binding protein with PASTA domain